MRNKGRQAMSVLTVNDRVRLERRRWEGQTQGSVQPLDEVAGLAQATISRGVRELACQVDQGSRSFERTAQTLRKAAQVTVGKETLRQVIETEGREVLQSQRTGALAPSWRADDARTDSGSTRVYLSCDGVHVPVITQSEKRKRRTKVKAKRRQRSAQAPALPPLPRMRRGTDQAYKEFKLVAFYDESNQHRHCAVTHHDHRMAQVLMSRESRRIQLHQAQEKIANVDGATWIKHRIEDAKLDLDGIGLDFYHLAENIHKARRAVFGEESDPGRQWAADLLHTVKHEGYQPMRDRLHPWRKTLRGKIKRQAAERLLKYVEQRRDMIDYPRFLKNGWQIGSGPVESLCKTTPSRVKRSGRRWDPANAQAVMALTNLDQNRQWPAYWRLTLN